MAIPTASSTGPPTNKEILKTAMLVLWIVILNMVDARLTSQRYPQQMQPTLPPPDDTFTELAFKNSRMVSTMSLLVLIRIMTELSINWSDGPRRLINRIHLAFLRGIYLATWMLWIVRCEAVKSVNDEFLLMFMTTVVLVQTAKVGWLGMLLRWVKRRFMK